VFHGAKFWQESLALCYLSKRVDHPCCHVVDRDVGGRRRATLRQFLEYDGRIEPRERGAADVIAHINAAKSELRRLPQRVDRKDLALIPRACVRHHFGAGKIPRGLLKSLLFFAERKIHGHPTGCRHNDRSNSTQPASIPAVA
jgi:hypothetical protein